MILKSEERIKEINTKLAWLAQYVKFNNQQGMTDINKAVENFFCGLLNIIFDASLVNMNYILRDYPAVDLGDEDNRLAVQVTSTSSRDKIIHTLDKFFEHHLDDHYNRLVVLIVGKKEDYRKKFPTKRNFPFDKDRDIWDVDRLGKEIDELEDDAQEKINQYLDKQMKLPWEEYQKAAQKAEVKTEAEIRPVSGEKKLKNYLPDTLGVDGFKGREAELELLAKAFDRHENPIFITGLGGIGKTELAIRFCQPRQDDHTVHFARFAGTFEDTVTQGIALGVENLWLSESCPKEQIYHEVMRVLADCDSKTILIIDNADPKDGNFDSLKDETYRKLCRMNLRLIITTRAIVPGGVKVKRMSNDDLREIIGRYAEISREDADALIDAVDGHTLTVDLMGRAMQPGWKRVTPAMLLDALRKNALSETIGKTVKTDYNRDQQQEIRQQKIHEHLRTVFNVVDIPENAKQAMCCATLLPEAGMDADLFANALPESAQAALDALSNRAWLRVNNANMVTIHPVVRLLCFEELKPTDEICRAFLENLWGNYDKKKYDHDLYSTMAELYTTAAEKLENERVGWSGRARALWHKVGQYEKALHCAKMTIERREASLLADDPDLADAYNDMGLVYARLDDHRGMEEYYGQALEIRQRTLEVDHVDLAKSYNNVGEVYGAKGDYRTSLTYKLKALEVFERILPKNDRDLATSYNNVGSNYNNLGDHQTALEYHERALMIREKVLSADNPVLAKSYNNVGSIYGELGDHCKALEYHEKALAIHQKALPADHPDLATSYAWMGDIYGKLGDHRTSLEYHERALAIRKKVLPVDHPDLAFSYSSFGYTYGILKKYPLAVEYLEKALRICEAKLPPGHRDMEATRYWLDKFRQKLENQHPSWMDQVNRAQEQKQEEQ